ncbi:DUF6541 family protein [Kutzneria sp. CA-103260]|uniref:DUF6541 family protein n=1 Tax=Kutzneria sp. CA-103260 TaxID=2802641 RepID=UPI001BA694B5|nr:DUF6541 family protein [Kutzneria sp. CA-103260]QUQ62793.1 hypothetical protein JJ691_05050 [Kutzneria sp. CA-103260]
MSGAALAVAMTAAVYLAVVIVPGALIGYASGIRGWLLAAASPVLTYGVIGIFGPLAPVIGIRWNALTLLGGSLLCAAVAFGLRRLFRSPDAQQPRSGLYWPRSRHWMLAGAVLIATAVGLLAMGRASGFTAIPQWWDAEFHANAIRFITDSGNSSPAALAAIDSTGSTSFFYPNAYHVLDATVAQIGGWSIPQVLDVGNGFQAGLFALTLSVLVAEVTKMPALAAATGILACAFTQFPYDTLVWGPLFPFTAGVAVIPALLALLCRVLAVPTSGAIVATALAGVGLTAVHPSVTVAAAIPAVFFLVQRWVTMRRVPLADLRTLLLVAVAGGVTGVFQVLGTLTAAGGSTSTWPASLTPLAATEQFVTGSRSNGLPAVWLMGLGAVGLIGLFLLRGATKLIWWLAGGVVFAGLFVLDASSDAHWVKSVTQPWWNDSWRLYAIGTMSVVVLAAVGLVTLARLLSRVVPRLHSAAAVVLVALLVIIATKGLYLNRNTARLAQAFPDGPVVTHTAEAGMHELAKLAPAGSMVMNDPYDGSPWMWALADVHPVFGHAPLLPQDAASVGQQRMTLFERFNKLDTDPAIQAAVRDLRVDYVFLSQGSITGAKPGHPDGLTGLDQVRSLKLVFQNSQTRIYQVASQIVGG